MSLLAPKSIGELLNENIQFWIPAYQRGYRWTSLQVTDLLDDIWEFHKLDPKKDDYYWLQPIVVKRYEEKIEVIDGQQRLTTVLLIIKYIQSIIPFYKGDEYSLTYETRLGSGSYIASIQDGEAKRNDNIDYSHMYSAFETIRDWFIDRPDRNSPVHLWQRLTDQVKILWYEIDDQNDAISLFTRINSGKIPLTNSELIKALFLSRTNIGTTASQNDYIKLKQIELAAQWDQIEADLQNPDFWYFLQPSNSNYDNHIEWLFELVTTDFQQSSHTKTTYETFYTFQDEIERRVAEGEERYEIVESIWKEVMGVYHLLKEWYARRELYHLIGYLLEVGEPIKRLVEHSKSMKKDAFVQSLYTMIQSRMHNWEIETLTYINDRGKIKATLLLHNIMTLQQDKHSKQRFDFDRYKNENWDIEHIHSVQSKVAEKQDEQISYIKDALFFIEDVGFKAELEETMEALQQCALEVEMFEKIQGKIIDYFGEDTSNHISNCTLLDSATNRSYKNSIFPKKREEIINRDQKGSYILPCTRNVFLKYYSKQTTQIHHWNKEDRDAYLEDILKVLSPVSSNH